jgi:tripartite-type tricarboxylate transporter receptor subunit TctC
MKDVLKSTKAQIVLVALACLAFALEPRLSPNHRDWPSGDIELIIPSGPGGGFDTYARVLARAMEENLAVKVVPRNIPGGDGQRGATVAYKAEPNGQTFAVFNLPGIMEPEITGQEVGYDTDKVDWLGAMALNQYIVVVAADAPYDTIDDLRRAGETVSFTAYGSSGIAANKVLCAETGLHCQIITGYPSNNEALLGVVRGDAVASVPPISTASTFNKNGDLKGILLMTDRDAPAFSGTQKAAAAGYPRLAELGLLRAFGLPPGVPEETRREFSTTFDKALAADSVERWAEATGVEFTPMSAEALRKRIGSQKRLLSRYRNVIAAEP